MRLSDFVSCGVVPAVLLYIWTMATLQRLGWVIVLLFGVCCALRLARFNTQIGADLPPYAYNFFTGVPAPAAARPLLIPPLFRFLFGAAFSRPPPPPPPGPAAGAAALVRRRPALPF